MQLDPVAGGDDLGRQRRPPLDLLAGEEEGRLRPVFTKDLEDRDRAEGASLLANVNPTFSWVRLAQRVPVRIRLDPVPDGMSLVAGRSATVEVLN